MDARYPWFVSFTLHEPIMCSYNCVIEKGFSEGEERDFPILTVLAPISQGTEVTKVTEYIFILIKKLNGAALTKVCSLFVFNLFRRATNHTRGL